ncbi:uncharacterized protein LOC115875014 [Sitophilus oryzae]|uniref:Uncharacterized protein LOC115875014 n=1 Tax=Sitophilus oryzae TaxID=7048 RepID=A0A6J2X5J0_SITOR|nr:uncharacterized protein LOC115875014 [Sitophilus oryzae]
MESKNIKKLSLMELHESLDRVSALLKKTVFISNLPDKGKHLQETKIKLEKEIAFHENLELTNKLLTNMSIHSDGNKVTYQAKICSIEKNPPKERFKPHVTIKNTSSDHKVQSIDLQSSLELQVKQQERVKAEQKVNLSIAKKYTEDNSGDNSEDSDEESSCSELEDRSHKEAIENEIKDET